jgi:hypothetical protein
MAHGAIPWKTVLMLYTFDLTDRGGKIYSFDLGEFPSDDAAKVAAEQLLKDHTGAESVTVWEDQREVARIRRAGAAPDPRPEDLKPQSPEA